MFIINESVRYASFWQRISASIIDTALVSIVTFVLTSNMNTTPIVTILVYLILSWLYYSVFFSSSLEATLGYKLNALKLFKLDKSRVGFTLASYRYLLSILSGTVFILNIIFFFSKRRQTFHDYFSKTVVLDNLNPYLYSKKKGKLTLADNLFYLPKNAKSIVVLWFIVVIAVSVPILYFMYSFALGFGVTQRIFETLPTSMTGKFGYEICRETILHDQDSEYEMSSIENGDDLTVYITGHFVNRKLYQEHTWLSKFNLDGEMLWKRNIGSTAYSSSPILITKHENNMLIARKTSTESFYNTVRFSSYDTRGSLLWEKTLSGHDLDINEIIASNDGYIAIGTMSKSSKSRQSMLVLKIDLFGKFQSQNLYGMDYRAEGHTVVESFDGGLIVAGMTTSPAVTLKLGGTGRTTPFGNKFAHHGWILKIDQNGTIIWDQVIDWNGEEETVVSMIKTNADELILAVNAGRRDQRDILIFKFNASGKYIWKKVIAGNYYDSVSKIELLSSGDYLIAGNTSSYGVGSGVKGWLIKLNELGHIVEDKTIDSFDVTSMRRLNDMTLDENGDILVVGQGYNIQKAGAIYRLRKIGKLPCIPIEEGPIDFALNKLERFLNTLKL